MKKTLLTLGAIILAGVFYYFTIGSKQITEEIKKEVNREIVSLKSSGFGIKTQKIDNSKEHFEIDFNDTKKITEYLTKKGVKDIDTELLEFLKGMVIGVDIEYNPSPIKAVAMDIYPIKLPTLFYLSLQDKNDTKTKAQIDKLLKNRELLAHIEINKLATAFDGYLKDINIDNEFRVVGFKFNGNLENETIKSINQMIEKMELDIPDENIYFGLFDFNAKVKNPLKDINKETIYTLKNLKIKNSENGKLHLLDVKDISGVSKDIQTKGSLVNSISKTKITEADVLENQNYLFGLKGIDIDFEIKNLNLKVVQEFEKLSNSNGSQSTQELIGVLKKLAEDNFKIEIPKFSISKIVYNKQEIEGFDLNASLFLNSSSINSLNLQNPNEIMNLLNAKLNIKASNELVSLISSNPNAMVLMMILQPIDKNGKKIYNIEFTQGTLKINGKPFL
jgi:hypothetical protein